MARKPGVVRRRLHLVSPGADRGGDVTALQRAVNRLYKHFRIDRQIAVDGEYGPQTASGARQIGLVMGAVGQNARSLRRGTTTMQVQSLIRGRARSKRERFAMLRRVGYRRALRKRFASSPGERVIAWARTQIGVTENPPGSNSGGPITVWNSYWGLVAAQWCGCFAGYAVKKVGGAKVSSWLPYAPSITSDAKAGRNGLVAVPFSSARAGDLVTFWNGAHIGLVVRVEGDKLYTIEGNTSSGSSGSQSNGGGVFDRVRSRSDVDVIARPAY